MDEQQQRRLRLGLLTELIARAPVKLGRTALMKLAYFLQTAKNVPLGYHFSLYTYGPFDSDLLADLDQAHAIGAVASEIVTFPSGKGYGYEFTPGPRFAASQKVATRDLMPYQDAIRWVLAKFGHRSAADLELLPTIVHADREASQARRRLSFAALARTVQQIKPQFSEATILRNIHDLAADGLLVAAAECE
jgi:uncharacterized protein